MRALDEPRTMLGHHRGSEAAADHAQRRKNPTQNCRAVCRPCRLSGSGAVADAEDLPATLETELRRWLMQLAPDAIRQERDEASRGADPRPEGMH